MEINAEFFPSVIVWVFGVLYAFFLLIALRIAPWRRLRDTEQLHVLLGSVVCLLLLWHIRAEVNEELSFHLLGVTVVTLMLGWSFAVIATSLTLAGVIINAGGGWDAFVINAVTTGVLPVTLTQVILVLVRHFLPRNFFIYVLGNGFLTAGLVGLISGYLVTWLLVLSETHAYAELEQTFLPFFPLMFLPEAFLNGWMTAVLVAFRPNWVNSFSDEQYLHGK